MLKRRLFQGAAVIVLLAGLGLIGKGAYIRAKAGLAARLLNSSWQETLEKGTAVKPWPWADTWPVARLMIPDLAIDLVVLEGVSGNVLAFGPGHMTPSPLPGQPGNAIISGHRDTSFRFLEKLQTGDRITVQTRNGSLVPFQVVATQIVDAAALGMKVLAEVPLLTLVTCYPFDALVPGGPMRYLVFAEYDGAAIAAVSSGK